MAGTRSLGAIAAVVVVLVVAGCAGSEDPLPSKQAAALVEELNALQIELGVEACGEADLTLDALFEQANEVPKGKVKDSLKELLDELDGLVAEQCVESPGPTTTDSTSTSSTTTESSTSETTTDSSDTTDTTTTTDSTDTTTDTTTTGGDTTDPGDGGLTPEGG